MVLIFRRGWRKRDEGGDSHHRRTCGARCSSLAGSSGTSVAGLARKPEVGREQNGEEEEGRAEREGGVGKEKGKGRNLSKQRHDFDLKRAGGGGSHFELLWHGGEPPLVSPRFALTSASISRHKAAMVSNTEIGGWSLMPPNTQPPRLASSLVMVQK